MVYDELFTTVIGSVTNDVFDSELWNNMMELQLIENQLDSSDTTDLSVTQAATDLFDTFVEDPKSDDDTVATATSIIPEGDDDADSSFSNETSDSQSPSAVPEGELEPYRTRSG